MEEDTEWYNKGKFRDFLLSSDKWRKHFSYLGQAGPTASVQRNKKRKQNIDGELTLAYTCEPAVGSTGWYGHLEAKKNGDHAKTAEWMTK